MDRWTGVFWRGHTRGKKERTTERRGKSPAQRTANAAGAGQHLQTTCRKVHPTCREVRKVVQEGAARCSDLAATCGDLRRPAVGRTSSCTSSDSKAHQSKAKAVCRLGQPTKARQRRPADKRPDVQHANAGEIAVRLALSTVAVKNCDVRNDGVLWG